MSEGRPPSDERMLPFLVNRFPPEAPSTPEPCPQAELLAGLCDGTLLPKEREVLERHLAGCEACGRLAAELVRENTPVAVEGARRGPTRSGFRVILAAAAALVALVAGWALFGPDAPPAGVEERLAAGARRLASAHPELFAGFQPLSHDERSAAPPVLRGGVALGFPAGKLLEQRPAFRWHPVPGVKEWSVTLRRQTGARLWTARSRTTILEYPADQAPLEPGKAYLWELAGDGPLGTAEAAQAFRMASETERRAFDAARRAIERSADPDIADLLSAHLAIRRGLLGAAERAARAAARTNPGEAIALETLRYVQRRLAPAEDAPHETD